MRPFDSCRKRDGHHDDWSARGTGQFFYTTWYGGDVHVLDVHVLIHRLY